MKNRIKKVKNPPWNADPVEWYRDMAQKYKEEKIAVERDFRIYKLRQKGLAASRVTLGKQRAANMQRKNAQVKRARDRVKNIVGQVDAECAKAIEATFRLLALQPDYVNLNEIYLLTLLKYNKKVFYREVKTLFPRFKGGINMFVEAGYILRSKKSPFFMKITPMGLERINKLIDYINKKR